MYEVEDYLKVVHSVINKYYGGGIAIAARTGIDPEDLFQVGCIGLMKACENYDPLNSEKASFITYAFMKIRGEISHFIRDDSYVVKFPRKIRELSALASKLGDPSIEEIRIHFDISYEEALDTYFCLNKTGVSFYRKNRLDGEMTLLDLIPAEEDTTEDKALYSVELKERLNILSENQRRVCCLLLEGHTQSEIANIMSITQASVSRLRIKSVAKIQKEYSA